MYKFVQTIRDWHCFKAALESKDQPIEHICNRFSWDVTSCTFIA